MIENEWIWPSGGVRIGSCRAGYQPLPNYHFQTFYEKKKNIENYKQKPIHIQQKVNLITLNITKKIAFPYNLSRVNVFLIQLH